MQHGDPSSMTGGAHHDACGVGFVADLKGKASYQTVAQALAALERLEHRGGCAADGTSGDGAGLLCDIPFDLLGYDRHEVAVAMIFVTNDPDVQGKALRIFEETFNFMGLDILHYRDVPVNPMVLGSQARHYLPKILQAIIKKPLYCKTANSFNTRLYHAKQVLRTKQKENGIFRKFFFASLSNQTIVYKAMTRSADLAAFYPDLTNPAFRSRFALFHRRFSTNTQSTWDKAQPFRMIGHNGEINTIAGNRSWSYSREQYLGLPVDQLLTHHEISDTGSLNEMVEAVKFRSSVRHIDDILAILIPPATADNSFYRFWSRAVEPWDGPALVTYSDGTTIGARLDRNGFRPARWVRTEDTFYLASEAGTFALDEAAILEKGALAAGSGVSVHLQKGTVNFKDPSNSRENRGATFDARLFPLEKEDPDRITVNLNHRRLFLYTQEEQERILLPMILTGKEPIGSMGDTAAPAVLSQQPRTLFDYFFQTFAQVTNPPLDYLRERMMTDLHTYLGGKPDIFEPKELVPPQPGLLLESPVLRLDQMASLLMAAGAGGKRLRIRPKLIATTFKREQGVAGFKRRLDEIGETALKAVTNQHDLLILSDQDCNESEPHLPVLLVLRAVVNALNRGGLRLKAAIVIHSGEIRTTHQLACTIGFGATAVCPYLALAAARRWDHPKLHAMDAEQKEANMAKALETGLLKIMAKMGISVVRAYQSAKLFTPLGLDQGLVDQFFPGLKSPIGGLSLHQVAERHLGQTLTAARTEGLPNSFQFKEHNKGLMGERHTMTNSLSKSLHKISLAPTSSKDETASYQAYLELSERQRPAAIRHLLRPMKAQAPLPLQQVEDEAEILRRFGAGAMSFGAINAEAQRDIFLAMHTIGGHSNSGEGGENPYYFEEGIHASIKQIASGRFGVTAEYLVTGNEVQIKIAQGAKPGEGGQLMGVKVTEQIAKARHANPGVDLISPPPLHDIYSIEDLKELIYELKQLKPDLKVNVKLVAGVGVGQIAVGVAKAGADIIHISGGEGGTGAAPLSSMKHAGLPWEIGLWEVQRALLHHDLRAFVSLRVDGGLATGWDIVTAAILGAEGFDFGKLLLIAEGCVMARICEKNTCPAGIATHREKFKSKYKGTPEGIIRLLRKIAQDARHYLAVMGVPSLQELIGRTDLLQADPALHGLIRATGIDLSAFTAPALKLPVPGRSPFAEGASHLNRRILDDHRRLPEGEVLHYHIGIENRAILAALAGDEALRVSARRKDGANGKPHHRAAQRDLIFTGSAGLGFAVFLTAGFRVRLLGEANDSVCKSMSGGEVVITPHPQARFEAHPNSIIGNAALYGATGGTLLVNGRAGDRFAVRNSGACAVVEGTGLHACEYMTGGTVVILGPIGPNAGAGMTGGRLFLYGPQAGKVNSEYLLPQMMDDETRAELKSLLRFYEARTGSAMAQRLLAQWQQEQDGFTLYQPRNLVEKEGAPPPASATDDADHPAAIAAISVDREP